MPHNLGQLYELCEKKLILSKKGVSGVSYLKKSAWKFCKMYTKLKHVGPLIIWNWRNSWQLIWTFYRNVPGWLSLATLISSLPWEKFWAQVEKEEKLLKNQKSKDKKSVDKNPTADQVTDQLEMVAKELEDVKALEEEEEEEEVNNESDK